MQQSSMFQQKSSPYDEVYESAASGEEEEAEEEEESPSEEEAPPPQPVAPRPVSKQPGTLSILWSSIKRAVQLVSPLYWWGVSDQDTHVLFLGSLAVLAAEAIAVRFEFTASLIGHRFLPSLITGAHMLKKYPTTIDFDSSRHKANDGFPKIEDEEQEAIDNRKAIKAAQRRFYAVYVKRTALWVGAFAFPFIFANASHAVADWITNRTSKVPRVAYAVLVPASAISGLAPAIGEVYMRNFLLSKLKAADWDFPARSLFSGFLVGLWRFPKEYMLSRYDTRRALITSMNVWLRSPVYTMYIEANAYAATVMMAIQDTFSGLLHLQAGDELVRVNGLADIFTWAPMFVGLIMFKREYSRIAKAMVWIPRYIRRHYIDPLYEVPADDIFKKAPAPEPVATKPADPQAKPAEEATPVVELGEEAATEPQSE